MVEHYPRIYSLSTLNIRQHFNCDYRFHKFRTDFSGESGSGKSLIADFIQLLLVGSSVFRSGTEGVKARDTSGLALKGDGDKYGRGYLLLNIETGPRKYLTLGGYLETSNSQMQFFIVQAGYDFDKTLTSMDQPVRYRDLLVNEQIEPLDRLEQSFLEKGYLKTLTQKRYHQLLFDNGILAVDLSQSRQRLSGYAGIIRSFSRGKGFYNNSDALKTFLFGEDDHKRLIDKYHEEVQSISMDAQQHQRLQEEIDQIRDKEKAIVTVSEAFKAFQKTRDEFRRNTASFWHVNQQRLLTEKATAQQVHTSSTLQRILIQQRILKTAVTDLRAQHNQLTELNRKLGRSGSDTVIFKTQADSAKVLLDQSNKNKAMIDKVEQWLIQCDQDLPTLNGWYRQERAKEESKDVLDKFMAFLDEHRLTAEFEKSLWFTDPDDAAELSADKLNTLTATKTLLETQLTFSDIQNPNSLAGWAMANLSFPLSHEQESMLIHFQALDRTEPEHPAGRYLPFPEDLFKEPVMVNTPGGGFWLALSGIYEHIDLVKVRYLDVPLSEVAASLKPLATLREEIAATQQSIQQFRSQKKQLEGYPGLVLATRLYRDHQTDLFEAIDEIGELTGSEFHKYLQAYEAKDSLLADHEAKLAVYENGFESWMASQSQDKMLMGQISGIEQAVKRQYGGTDFDTLISDKEDKLLTLENELEALQEQQSITVPGIQQEESALFKMPPSADRLYEMSMEAEKTFVRSEKALGDMQLLLASAHRNLQQAKLDFLRDIKRDFDAEIDLTNVSKEPDDTESNHAESRFTIAYDTAAAGIEDKTILATYSVGILAHKLLPTVFQTYDIREDLIGEQIEKRLTELARDLQRIGSRKIEILHRVFNEVESTYNGYLTKVQQIGNYLRHKDRAITGGSHATLITKPITDFPDDWMKVFRKRLNSEAQNTGLFAPMQREDIDQIMVTVFRDAGGKKDAGYKDLLDPRAYFDLIFDIKLEDGQSNAGSNGQTYTANALLCLARLSLIEDSERPGIKIMPIDEAEGLGSNYEMLHALAKKEKYQLVTMSIETAGDISNDGQYIYIMHDNKESDGLSYVPPLAIFNKGEITANIHEIFEETE